MMQSLQKSRSMPTKAKKGKNTKCSVPHLLRWNQIQGIVSDKPTGIDTFDFNRARPPPQFCSKKLLNWRTSKTDSIKLSDIVILPGKGKFCYPEWTVLDGRHKVRIQTTDSLTRTECWLKITSIMDLIKPPRKGSSTRIWDAVYYRINGLMNALANRLTLYGKETKFFFYTLFACRRYLSEGLLARAYSRLAKLNLPRSGCKPQSRKKRRDEMISRGLKPKWEKDPTLNVGAFRTQVPTFFLNLNF